VGVSSSFSHIVKVALASVCQPIIVVLGAYAERIQPELDLLKVNIIKNPLWYEGMSTSIRLGVETLNIINPDVEAVVIMLCDQPFVNSQLINQLVEVHKTNHQLIVASEYANTMGVPALFHRALFAKLTTLSGKVGAKQIIKNYAQEVLAIPFPQGLIDLDTPQDYEQLMAENQQPTTMQIP
ncbi:MAG: nucleotidyltransferase family protein, partial [Nostoc sp. TH1S01]|nr:nucleotidyltransferase family protein [Nostoc sp. TH1S01]